MQATLRFFRAGGFNSTSEEPQATHMLSLEG